jgi:hypothetical protein
MPVCYSDLTSNAQELHPLSLPIILDTHTSSPACFLPCHAAMAQKRQRYAYKYAVHIVVLSYTNIDSFIALT